MNMYLIPHSKDYDSHLEMFTLSPEEYWGTYVIFPFILIFYSTYKCIY